MLHRALRRVLAWSMLGMAACAQAQGVTDTEIVFGQTTGITGPVAGSVKESNEGIKLYFDWINAQGGINGRKLVLQSVDDKFDPKLAGENARKIVADKPPIAFLLTRGTPHTEAVIPSAKEAKIPIIAPGTGAEIFHTPVNPLIFNLRAKYQAEVEKAVEHLNTLGTTRIALVHVGDSFGADARAGFERKMSQLKLTPVLIMPFDRATGDTAPAAAAIAKANPAATIVIGTVAHVSGLMNRVRKDGGTTQFVTLSNNGTKSFVTALGANARGVMVVQAFPNPRGNSEIAREIKRLAKDKPDLVISQQTVEGFAAAKLVTEGLKRAGKKPTPQLLVSALESIRDYDMGGFLVSYGPSDHTGGEFVEMSVIDARGEFLQ
jgi:ABC-type branched-subunit amino acid transport system substrate-binding protein